VSELEYRARRQRENWRPPTEQWASVPGAIVNGQRHWDLAPGLRCVHEGWTSASLAPCGNAGCIDVMCEDHCGNPDGTIPPWCDTCRQQSQPEPGLVDRARFSSDPCEECQACGVPDPGPRAEGVGN
jgi:hypothetical protein